MTSDCAGEQVSNEPKSSDLVKAAGAIGSPDRLNEAPQVPYWFCMDVAIYCDDQTWY